MGYSRCGGKVGGEEINLKMLDLYAAKMPVLFMEPLKLLPLPLNEYEMYVKPHYLFVARTFYKTKTMYSL